MKPGETWMKPGEAWISWLEYSGLDGGTWSCHQLRVQAGAATLGLGSAPFSVSVGDKDTGVSHLWR